MSTARAAQLSMLGILLALTACGGSSAPLAVPAPEEPPVVPEVAQAVDDAAAVSEAGVVFVDVLANDQGVDTVELLQLPMRGAAVVEDGERIRYQSDAGFNGTDTLTYAVRDEEGTQHTATVRVTVYETVADAGPIVLLPRTSIQPEEVAVLVNDDDPHSVAVAAYYVEKRRIPAKNVIHLNFSKLNWRLTAEQFAPVYAAADAAAGDDIQAYVLTWTRPYAVEGMSMTSAFALGYDEKWYDYDFCSSTAFSAYFNSSSTRPYTDLGVRPAMMLASLDMDYAKALIDRGVAADDTFPTGVGYMVRTSDGARSVRWPRMVLALSEWDHAPDGLEFVYQDNSDRLGSDTIENADDVLFYLTGLSFVPNIGTNTYLPGAVADHLTSFGGRADSTDDSQMSCRRWLEAGATASYGTVIEPCNYTAKFPAPQTLFSHYYRGGTVLEAYWKSVAWPGEGLFVGEPLARPWGRAFLRFENGTLTIRTTCLEPGQTYRIMAADDVDGPFDVALDDIQVAHHQVADISLPGATRAVYRLELAPSEGGQPPLAPSLADSR